MNRRELLGFGAAAAGMAVATNCGFLPAVSTLPNPARLGFLTGSSLDTPHSAAILAAFRKQLPKLGWVEGHNLIFEERSANGQTDQLARLAAELIRTPVDALTTWGAPATAIAKAATTTVPIVFVNVNDPIAWGLVPSLAHPGGNLTGSSSEAAQIYVKALELLSAIVSRLSRLAVLFNGTNPGLVSGLSRITTAAGPMGLQVRPLDARSLADVDSTLAAAKDWQSDALMVLVDSGPIGVSIQHIVDFAVLHLLPTGVTYAEYVQAGGLVSYGADAEEQGRLAAAYVDKILRGARPADLPVQQPTVFDLAVNLKTAHALGLTIPDSVTPQVTEWVQ